jgi:adenosylmethionine-8-amino-7-oxononanoate aminotransferase
LGAAVCSDRIFDTIMVQGSGHFVHGHTYAGNPLSCAIGDKVLEITERDGCVDNAAVEGAYLLAALEELTEIPIVGDVRGKGLLLGIEFVKDRQTREPFAKAAKVAHKVTEACLEVGVVLYPGGGSAGNGLGDHVLIAPPLTITREQTKDLVRMVRAGIEKVAQEI